MRKQLIIIKIGGSVITAKKRKTGLFKPKQTKEILDQIIKAKKKQDFDLILIHGGGSFGHATASKYQLQKGLTSPESAIGLVLSKLEMNTLVQKFWHSINQKEMLALPIQTYAITTTSNGTIVNMDTDKITKMLEMGVVPILFGDEVLDDIQGISECSSDQIATYLASRLKPELLLFITDVDGVYNDNPVKSKTAVVIKNLPIKDITKMIQTIEQINPHNVTGEMAGKLSAITAFPLDKDSEVRIMNGLDPVNIFNVLTRQDHERGTRIIVD